MPNPVGQGPLKARIQVSLARSPATAIPHASVVFPAADPFRLMSATVNTELEPVYVRLYGYIFILDITLNRHIGVCCGAWQAGLEPVQRIADER